MDAARPNAIKHSCVEFGYLLEIWPISEAYIDNVTDLIGQFQWIPKFYTGILFIESFFPAQTHFTEKIELGS